MKTVYIEDEDVRGEISPLSYGLLRESLLERGWQIGDEIALTDIAERRFTRGSRMAFIRRLTATMKENVPLAA